MRIASIEIIETSIPLKKPYKLSKRYGFLKDTNPVIVKINTDEGLTGYGETDPMGKFTGETPETVAVVIKKYLAPTLIDEDPTNILRISEIMESMIRDNHMAKGTIEMACHDLLAKVAGMPLYRLLGGPLQESLPIMGAIGCGTTEETMAAAKKVKESLYHSIMIKVGGDPVNDAEQVLAARDALGKDFPIILDANQGYDMADALKFIEIAEGANPVLYEQPIDAEDIEGTAAIRRKCNTPVSVDESLLSFRHAQEVIRLDAADVFSIKVCKNGGIRPSLKIIELAKNNGIDILFNSMIEEGITQAASLNIGLTVSNLFKYGHAYFSPLRLDADITNYSSLIVNGRVQAPTEPGLGISILDDVLERYTNNTTTIS